MIKSKKKEHMCFDSSMIWRPLWSLWLAFHGSGKLWQTFVTWLVVVRSVVSVTAFYHNSSPDHKYWMTSGGPPLYILSNKASALDIGLRPQSVGYMSDIMEKATAAAARSINFGHKCETHLPCPCYARRLPKLKFYWHSFIRFVSDILQVFCMFFPLPYQKKASKQYM